MGQGGHEFEDLLWASCQCSSSANNIVVSTYCFYLVGIGERDGGNNLILFDGCVGRVGFSAGSD